MKPEHHLDLNASGPELGPEASDSEASDAPDSIEARLEQGMHAIPALAGKADDLRHAPTTLHAVGREYKPQKARRSTVAALIVIAAAVAALIAYDLGETRFESLFSSTPEDPDADLSTGE